MFDIDLKGLGIFAILAIIVFWLLIPSRQVPKSNDFKTYVVEGKEYICPKNAKFDPKTLSCFYEVCPVGFIWNSEKSVCEEGNGRK